MSRPELYCNEPFPHAPMFAGVAVAGFLFTLWWLLWPAPVSGPTRQSVASVLLALWVLGPPLWFFVEFFYYFPAYGNMAPGAGYALLKDAQDVTAKVWVAMAAVLGALYNKSFPAGP